MKRLIQFLIFIFCLFCLTSQATPFSKDDLNPVGDYQVYAASGSCYYKDDFGQLQPITSISTILTGDTWIILGEDGGIGVSDYGKYGVIILYYKNQRLYIQNEKDPQTKKWYKLEGPLYDLLYTEGLR